MRPQQEAICDIERIVEISRWMILWCIQCIKVVIFMLNLRPFCNLETHTAEDFLYPFERLCHWVLLANLWTPTWEGDVNFFPQQASVGALGG